MAEAFAALLTSAYVGMAIDRLRAYVGMVQGDLLWNFRDDLEEMKDVLETISAVLRDAERRSVKEKLVQLLLKRLKHAAIDICDMLQDYQDTDDQLTSKVSGVLTRLQIVRKKTAMANWMKSMREVLRKIRNDFYKFDFTMVTGTSVEHLYVEYETTPYLPGQQLIGRDEDKQEIINLLSTSAINDETQIAAIYGLGGMGKSALAQQVYNDAQFSKKYDHRIWVYVSQDFNLRKIGMHIISQISVEVPQQGTLDELQVIHQCLDNLLHGKKVLIVLDDLWEEHDTALEKLRHLLQVGRKGSMIDVIVTTRNEDIARKVSTMTPYKLQPLKDDTCWEIIKRCCSFEDTHNQEWERIGLDIAKKCGGMALAAQAVGYILQFKHLNEWIEINNSDIWNGSSKYANVLLSLMLSYERMPPRLRICFSYCAIIPKEHYISEDDLIHQWAALGFIEPTERKYYIRKLLAVSFLQVSKLPSASGEYMVRYTMHNLVHDLAKLTLGDELIYAVASKSNDTHGLKYCRYALVTKYDHAMELSNIFPSEVRALHFSDSSKLNLASGAFSFANCLHILDFSRCSSILLPSSIGQLKQLKCLIAPRMHNEVLPEYITELSQLNYLNLSGSKISALPESFGVLKCMMHLDLSGCSSMSHLPESFGDLKCMMHLDLSGCSGIRELPKSFGDLTNLQCLELSECSSLQAIPESLCGLTQLQYLNLSCCYIERLPEAIGSLVYLQDLNMSQCRVRELPESFMKLHNLLHLDLKYSCIEKGLSGALLGLTALKYLDMSEYRVENSEKDDLTVAMRNLTNLEVLNLASSVYELFYVGKDYGYLDFIGVLTNLEHLDLSRNGVIKYLPEIFGDLHRLHTLNLEYCKGLDFLPESISGASSLKYLMVVGCSPELIDRANSLFSYSLTSPFFEVRHAENLSELHIAALENIRFLEEAQEIQLFNKNNLLGLTLAWTLNAGRVLEDNDLLGELVPPRGLKNLCLQGYSSPTFPSWVMAIFHHLPNLTCIGMVDLPTCTNLPPLGQLPHLESLCIWSSPSVTKIDEGICGGKPAFRRLKELAVGNMQGLAEWNITYPGKDGVEEFMFPVLDVFQVFCCPRLRLKPCLPKCRECTIAESDEVIFSVQELTSSHHCNSTPITSLTITNSWHHSFTLFHHFPALQELRFSVCPNLTSLPEGIQELSSLQSLALDMCASISALPEWLSDISSLKRLVIRECTGINALPPCIQQLTNLQNLVIGDNQKLQQWCESEDNKAKLAHINDIIYE